MQILGWYLLFVKFQTHTLGCLRYREKHGKDILISCGCFCCLQTCNSIFKMLIMGLGLRQNLMVISPLVYSYMQKYLYPLIMYYKSAFVVVYM